MSDETYIVVGDDGTPKAVVDLALLTEEGAKLGAAMALSCDDPERLDAITAEAVEKYDDPTYSFVISAALRMVTENILAPCMAVAHKATGIDLRDGLDRILRGEEPPRV
ncbi:hypothetical protein RB614_37680 [Phytohabitans sp. ZYX-F-186]|uniref:Uncharacterized protein n=1 Tax=Phytohabitans maris TaxID=3071409 RepID=A0ABU0ZTD3_9ACTN|nr:hypothetical protein [Phytohabitans sp. ZYX-F-186]MDQ7910240.1 hypothetical protein [Phytohabitans sp. ZYX-F-186]